MNAENAPNVVQANAAAAVAAETNVIAGTNAGSQANAAPADTNSSAPHVATPSNVTPLRIPQQQQHGELPPRPRARAPGSGIGGLAPAPQGALDRSMWHPSRRNGQLRNASMPSGIPPRQRNRGAAVSMGTIAPRNRQVPEVAFTHGNASFRLQASGEINPEDDNYRPLHNEVRQINDSTATASVQGRAASRDAFSQVTEGVRNNDTVEFLVHVSRRREDRRLEHESRRRRYSHLQLSREPSTRTINRQRRQAQQSQPAPASASFPARVEELSSEPQPPQPPSNACANCGRSDHVLVDCVTRWHPSGDIPGCYRCNTLQHTIDTCQQEPPLTDEARYDAEVLGRVGRQPLRSRRGWNTLAIQFGHDVPGPISRIRMQRVHPNHFQNWDYSRPAYEQADMLVPDPATENLTAILTIPDQGYEKPGDHQHHYQPH